MARRAYTAERALDVHFLAQGRLLPSGTGMALRAQALLLARLALLLCLAAQSEAGVATELPRYRRGSGAPRPPPQQPPRRNASAAAPRRQLQGSAQDTTCPVGASVTVSNTPMPTELVEDSLTIERTEVASRLIRQINSGADGLIINEQLSSFRGGMGAAGIYDVDELHEHGAPYCIPRDGIVLSTGNVRDYGAGPSEGAAGGNTYWGTQHPGHRPIDDDELLLRRISDARSLANQPTGGNSVQEGYHDVARLDIYFSIDDSRVDLELTFDLVFASEEYAEFAGTAFVDAFGIFVNGVNVAEFNGQPLNIDHSDMRFFGGTELNGVCAANGDDPILQNSIPMTGMDCGVHDNMGACETETFGQSGEGCGSTGCDYTVCHWEPTDGVCYNTLTYIIADTFDEVVDTTVYIMSLGADVDCSGIEPPDHGLFCREGCTSDACSVTGVLADKNTCVFECDPGYTYEGFVSCRTGSHVSRARCRPDPCVGIQPPSHGFLVGACEDGQMNSGELCNVRCDDGYEMSADGETDAALSCEAGILSPEVPICSDYTPPRITCTDAVYELSADGNCVTVDPQSFIGVHATATDDASDADPAITVVGDAGATCFEVLDAQPYYHSLTYVATDQAGLTSNCDVHLYVWHMDCPEDVTIGTDDGVTTASFTLPTPVYRGLYSGDQPAIAIAGATFGDKLPGNVVHLDLEPREHQLTYTTAAGPSLPAASCTMTVTVQDSEPPELFCPEDIVMSAPATFDATQAATGVAPLISAADNSGTEVQISAAPTNIDTQNLEAQEEPYSIDFIATETDGLALTDTCSVNIHVWDVVCPPSDSVGMESHPLTGGGGGRFTLPDASITGSRALFPPSVAVEVEGSTETLLPSVQHLFPTNTGTTAYVVTYTVEIDGDGIDLSSKTCTTTVTVADDIDPEMDCPDLAVSRVIQTGESIEIDASSYIDAGVVTATDNSGSSPTITLSSGPVGNASPGVVALTFEAVDAASNSASCSFDLQVWSVECPEAMELVAESGKDYRTVNLPEPDVLPLDLAAAPRVVISIPGKASAFSPGESVPISLAESGISLTYTVSLPGAPDDTKTCDVPISVRDNETPVFDKCPADVVLRAGNSGDNGYPWASVNIGDWLASEDLVYSDNSGPDNVGLSWQDSTGQTDQTPVVFELQSEPLSLTLTATDDSDLTDSCIVPVFLWSASCNDLTAIVAPFTSSEIVPYATLNLTNAGPTITGNLDPGALVITPTKVGADGEIHDIDAAYPLIIELDDLHKTITYRIEDSAGHSMTCDADVTVVDNEKPSFEYCHDSRTFQTGADVSYATFSAVDFIMVARDNSGATPTITHTSSEGITETGDVWTMEVTAGTQTVRFEARDEANAGDPAVCAISVTVTDETAPVIVCPDQYVRAVPAGETSVQVDSEYFTTTNLVFASDNSGDPTITADPPGITPFTPGEHSMTFTAADETQSSECDPPIQIHVWNLQCNRPAITEVCETGQPYALVRLTNPTNPPYEIEGSTGGYETRVTVQKEGEQSAIVLSDGLEQFDVDDMTVQLSETGVVLSYIVELKNTPEGADNKRICDVVVTVQDDQSPVFDKCPGELVLLADNSDNGSVSIADLTAEGGPVEYSDNSGQVELTWQDGQSDPDVPVVFPLLDDPHTLTLTVTEAAGTLSATCEIDVYVWSIQCDGIAESPFVTSGPNNEGQGDAFAAVPIPFPTIRGAAAAVDVGRPHNLIVDAVIHTCPDCAEDVEFVDGTGAFTSPQIRDLKLEDSGMSITYSARSTSDADRWSDGQTATCASTITIEDDEAPTISCPVNVWVQSSNLEDEIARQAEDLLSEGKIVASDNAGEPDIDTTINFDRAANPLDGSIVYTARQSTTHSGQVLTDTCTVWVKAWDISCPDSIITATSEIITVLGIQHGGEGNAHASILIPPVGSHNQPIIQGAVPNQDLTITVGVPGREAGTVACDSVSDCGQVVEFPFLPTGGGALTYTVTLAESSAVDVDGGVVDVVRAADATCRTNVTVADDEDPVFCLSVEDACASTCEPEISVDTDTDQTYATIYPSTFTPEASDNSGLIVEVVSSIDDGYQLSLDEGSISVTFTATDTSGNTAACETQVVVSDGQAPKLECPSTGGQYPMELGQNTRVVVPSQLISRGMISAEDNSGLAPTVSDPENLELRSGSHTVTFMATDEAGNVGTCEVTLDVPCALVIGPIGSNSGWGETPPNHLTAGRNEKFEVALKDFYDNDYVENATVTATFTSTGGVLDNVFTFPAQHLSGNVHEIEVNIPVVGKYTGKVTVTEDGGAEGLVAEWSDKQVKPAEWSVLTTTVVGSIPVVLTAGEPSSSLDVQTMDSMGNVAGVAGAGVDEPLLTISEWASLGWETEAERLVDNADGTYSSVRVPDIVKAGSYLINLSMNGYQLAVSQPAGFRLIVLPEPVVDARESTAEGGSFDLPDTDRIPWFDPANCDSTEAVFLFFDIVPRDRFGNALDAVSDGGATFTVKSMGADDADHPQLADIPVERTGERYKVRIDGVRATTYRIIILLDGSEVDDSYVGESPYLFTFAGMPCPEEVEDLMQQRQSFLAINRSNTVRPERILEYRLVVTYQYNEALALACQLAAAISLIVTLVVVLKVWKLRLTEAVNLAGPTWMMCIGVGCLLSCFSVIIFSSGQMPNKYSDIGYANTDELCELKECALGEINHDLRVSDEMCMAKDAAPSIAFTVIWASTVVKLRRTYVSVVKQEGLSDFRLGLELFLLVAVQLAIKVHYYYTDPPQLHDAQEYQNHTVRPEPLNPQGEPLFPEDSNDWRVNPHFYCYSGSAAKYWGMDTGYHGLLLFIAVMLAYFNRDIVRDDSKKRTKNSFEKLLNETGNVSPDLTRSLLALSCSLLSLSVTHFLIHHAYYYVYVHSFHACRSWRRHTLWQC